MLKLSWHLNSLVTLQHYEWHGPQQPSGSYHLASNGHIFFNDRTIGIVLYVEDFLNGLLTTVKSPTSIPMIHCPASAKQTSSLFKSHKPIWLYYHKKGPAELHLYSDQLYLVGSSAYL